MTTPINKKVQEAIVNEYSKQLKDSYAKLRMRVHDVVSFYNTVMNPAEDSLYGSTPQKCFAASTKTELAKKVTEQIKNMHMGHCLYTSLRQETPSIYDLAKSIIHDLLHDNAGEQSCKISGIVLQNEFADLEKLYQEALATMNNLGCTAVLKDFSRDMQFIQAGIEYICRMEEICGKKETKLALKPVKKAALLAACKKKANAETIVDLED